MLLLRAVVRLLAVAWMVVVAVFGLAVAAFCFDAVIRLHSLRPDHLAHLPAVRRWVGHFLHRLEAHGPTAGLALLCGIGAVLIGLFILLSMVIPRRRHIAIMSHGNGTITARPRVLRSMARALASDVEGVTAVRRPRLRLNRRGSRGKLRLSVVRTAVADGREVERSVADQLQPVTERFCLRPVFRAERGGRGERVQ